MSRKIVKLRWKTSEVPIGRYRSFSKRHWPMAEFADGRTAYAIYCEDDYTAKRGKGEHGHAPLTLRFADWPEVRPEGAAAFTWRTFKTRFGTLAEAKAYAFAHANRELA